MNKYFKKIVFIGLSVVLIIPSLVFAASSAYENLQTVGQVGDSAPYKPAVDNELAGIASIVIEAFLGVLGVIFLAYLLYAGYNWMTAQGDEEKVTKAKDTIQRAIIGLIVIIGAYAITYFVFDKLVFGSAGLLK